MESSDEPRTCIRDVGLGEYAHMSVVESAFKTNTEQDQYEPCTSKCLEEEARLAWVTWRRFTRFSRALAKLGS
jgi:hypothetical protein